MQWKVVRDAPKDISGCLEMTLGASELCCYIANCKIVVSYLIIITRQIVYKDVTLHKIT
jgi:hypothetical protein